LTSGGGGEGTRDTAIPAALPELAAEAAPLLLLLLLLLELARGVCCGEQSLTTGNLASKKPKTSDKIFYNAQHHASATVIQHGSRLKPLPSSMSSSPGWAHSKTRYF